MAGAQTIGQAGRQFFKQTAKITSQSCCPGPSQGFICGTTTCKKANQFNQLIKEATPQSREAFRASVRKRLAESKGKTSNQLIQTKQTTTQSSSSTNTYSSQLINTTSTSTQAAHIFESTEQPKFVNQFQNVSFIEHVEQVKPFQITQKQTPSSSGMFFESFSFKNLFYSFFESDKYKSAIIIQKHCRSFLAKKIYLETAILQGLNGLTKLKGDDKVVKRLLPVNLNDCLRITPLSSESILSLFMTTIPTSHYLGNLININDTSKLEHLSLSDIRNKAMLAKLKQAIKNENLIELSSLNGDENVIDNLSNNEKLTLSSLLKRNFSNDSYVSFNLISNLASDQINQFKNKFEAIFNKIAFQLQFHPLKKEIITLIFKELSIIKNPAIGSFSPLVVKNENNFYEKILMLHDKIETLNTQQLKDIHIKPSTPPLSALIPNLLFTHHTIFPTQLSPILLKNIITSKVLSLLSSECEFYETLHANKIEAVKKINKLLSSNQLEDEGTTDVESSVDENPHDYYTDTNPNYIELNSLKFKILSTNSIDELVTELEILNKIEKKINRNLLLETLNKSQEITSSEYQMLKSHMLKFSNNLNIILASRTSTLIHHLKNKFDHEKDQKIVDKFTNIIRNAIANKNYKETEKILKSINIKFHGDEQINALLKFLLDPFQKLHHTTIN